MLVRGLHPESGQPVRIRVRDGRIAQVQRDTDDGPTAWISPGWIDLQVNGFAGVDYNDPAAPHDEIARSIDVQRSTGVARFYPTVITGSREDMVGSLANLARARRTLANGDAMLGFHVEGPWISPDDGPRGAHPQHHVRGPTIEEFERFQDAADGHIGLVTLGPEHPAAPAVIEHIVRRGVVASIGHTGATPRQIEDAVDAGATMSTHLGNGAHPTVPRHGNYIVQQLADDRLYAGLILDGIHLPPPFVKMALRTKGRTRSILVTDAVMPAHCRPGLYQLGEQEVELTADQQVQLTSSGRLAGSALSMDRGIGNALRFSGWSLLEATRLATANPARAMGIRERSGYLEPGQAADFTLFSMTDDQRVEVRQTVLQAN